jgi:hypothetical protein
MPVVRMKEDRTRLTIRPKAQVLRPMGAHNSSLIAHRVIFPP